MKRPGIVTFNALLNLFFGVIFTFLNLYLIATSNPHQGGSALDISEWDWDVIKWNVPLTIVSVASIFVFIGLWRLRPWGRTLFNAVNVLLGLAMLYLVFLGGLESTVAKIVLGILALVFFTAPLGMGKPEIKEAFKA
jgi:hypothetical protein